MKYFWKIFEGAALTSKAEHSLGSSDDSNNNDDDDDDGDDDNGNDGSSSSCWNKIILVTKIIS